MLLAVTSFAEEATLQNNAVSSPEDQALLDQAYITASRFVAALDAGRARKAESFAYIREFSSGRKGPFPSERMLEDIIRRRKAYGQIVSRTLTSSQLRTTLVGMPDGKYARFVFDLVFQKKSNEAESVTVTMEGQQRGKVILYQRVVRCTQQ